MEQVLKLPITLNCNTTIKLEMSVCSVSHSVARGERIDRNILEHQSVFFQQQKNLQGVYLECVIQSVFIESVSFQNAFAMLCIQRARARG